MLQASEGAPVLSQVFFVCFSVSGTCAVNENSSERPVLTKLVLTKLKAQTYNSSEIVLGETTSMERRRFSLRGEPAG